MIKPAFEILNQRGTPMFFSDVFANRPDAGIVGRIFISTDTFAFYRDNGVTWDLIGGPGTGTITGSGTAFKYPVFTNTQEIGDGTIEQLSTKNQSTKDFEIKTSTDDGIYESKLFLTNRFGGNDDTITFQYGKTILAGSPFLKISDNNATFPTSNLFYQGGQFAVNDALLVVTNTIQNNVADFFAVEPNVTIQATGVSNGAKLTFAASPGTFAGIIRLGNTGNIFQIRTFADVVAFQVNDNTSIQIPNLGGSGSRMVVVDNTGLLSQQAIPSGTIAGTIAAGQVAFGSASNTIAGSNNLFWDNVNGSLGISNTSLLGYNLRVSKTFVNDGTGNGYGIVCDGSPTNLLGSSQYFRAQLNTSAGSVTDLVGYVALVGSSSATITNIYGFVASSTLTSATNNFGFWSNIASGTGRWNFYAAGTANNYYNGNIGVGIVPNAWGSGSNIKAIQNNGGNLWNFGSTNLYLGHNYYFDGTNRIFVNTGTASEYRMTGGEHYWYNSNTAAAGSIATFTQRMLLNSAGRLIIGNGTDTTELLQVNGTAKVTGASNFGGNMLISVNSATNTAELHISNNLSGNTAGSQIKFSANSTSGLASVGKFSTLNTNVKIIQGDDFYIYNDSAGNISILNNFATGIIKLAAGGSSITHLSISALGVTTFTSNGNITDLYSSNTSNTTTTQANVIARAGSTLGYIISYGQTHSGYKTITAGSTALYKSNTAGNITILNDSTTGLITFAAGASSTAQWTIGINGDLTAADGENIIVGTTTGTKIGTATSQKIGLWNATPIVQPTTAVASATFNSPGGGSAIKTDDTFDGYTLQQVVKALRDIGILA